MSKNTYLANLLVVGKKSSTSGVGGGNTTPGGPPGAPPGQAHALDGPQHTAATQTDVLLATVDRSGLLPPLSGDPDDALRGDLTWAPAGVPSDILDIPTAETDTTLVLAPDGAGGVEFRAEARELQWFNVMDPAYGAVNDGSTNDKAAINLAIAAFNVAGGVLYFPAGTGYYTDGAFDALTKPGLVLGDGMGQATTAASKIVTDSATAALFTVSTNFLEFKGLGLACTATTPSAGGAIVATTGHGSICSYRHLWINGFYDGLVVRYGSRGIIDGCQIVDVSRYGVWHANIDSPDGGDWSMSNTEITTSSVATHTPVSAIRQDSAGGMKLVNVKINGDSSHRFVTGYDLNINGSANDTSILTFVGSSIENVSGDAVLITTTGTGSFGLITIAGLQVGLYSNNTGRAVKISAASTGGKTAAGGIGIVTIDGLVAYTDGTARAAVELVNTDRVTLGTMALQGFNARCTSSGDTNTIDSATYTLTVKDEGTPLATGATSIDFVGSGVTATGTGAAKTVTIPGGAATLDDLTDVTITSPAVADRLRYNGSGWVNSALIWAPVMVLDPGTGNYLVLTDTSGNPIMAEV